MLKGLLLAATLITSLSAFAADKQVDLNGSKLTWFGKKVASGHTGHVKLQNGTLKFNDKNELTGGQFTIDMTSMTTTDLQGEWADKLIGHLKSDDFFSTEKYKTSTLVLKDVKKTAANKYKVTGDLTIKGTTAPVTFDADVNGKEAKGKVVFDRTKYNVQYSSGKFFQNLGDKLILDEVELDVDLKLN